MKEMAPGRCDSPDSLKRSTRDRTTAHDAVRVWAGVAVVREGAEVELASTGGA
jgi:hypothetical protein